MKVIKKTIYICGECECDWYEKAEAELCCKPCGHENVGFHGEGDSIYFCCEDCCEDLEYKIDPNEFYEYIKKNASLLKFVKDYPNKSREAKSRRKTKVAKSK